MLAKQIDDREVEFNDSGYMLDFDDWDDEIANALALADNLELTDDHWTIISFIRDFFGEYEVTPSSNAVIKAVGDMVAAEGSSSNIIDQLFPLDGYDQACRVAGLPESF